MGETFSQILYTVKTSDVTSLSRTTTGTIKVPEGLDGRLKRILATVFGVMTTVVNAGGLVEIENDAVKGMECSFVAGGGTAVTEGGANQNEAQVLEVDYPLIGGSTYTIHYTPQNIQSQGLCIELEYEKEGKPDPTRANHVKADMVLKTSAISQITVDEAHNTIDIPKGHGGVLMSTEVMVFPTLETVVNAGGKAVIHNTVEAWKPFEQVVGGGIALGASGGYQIKPNKRACNKPMTGNSTVTLDYTPRDDQSQCLGLTLFWRGKDPT